MRKMTVTKSGGQLTATPVKTESDLDRSALAEIQDHLAKKDGFKPKADRRKTAQQG